MPSKTDFNVSPYYDDFSESKKFHRVMYRPAFAVQARELTSQQTILQNQIEKLGDSMYKHGSMVIPGEATFDLNHFSIKLTSFTGTLSNFTGTTLTGGTSGVTAVVQSVDAELARHALDRVAERVAGRSRPGARTGRRNASGGGGGGDAAAEGRHRAEAGDSRRDADGVSTGGEAGE